MENAILGALFNDFVPKLTVETHIYYYLESICINAVIFSDIICMFPNNCIPLPTHR